MQTKIRPYANPDRKFLIQGLERLLDYLVELDDWQRLRRDPSFGEVRVGALLKEVQESDGLILVAEVNGRPVGFAVGTIGRTDPIGALECHPITRGNLVEFFVDPSSRRSGVGSMLLERLEEHFESRGCTYIGTEVFAPNLDAQCFYRQVGFEERDIFMMKPLGKHNK